MEEAASAPGEITIYLRRLSGGDRAAEAPLAEAVYSQIRSAAHSLLRGRENETLQATSLVNIVLLELLRLQSVEWHDRGHFFQTAARMLRRRFIDHIRAKRAAKRPSSATKTDLEDLMLPTEERFEEILDVHLALVDLAKLDPDLAELVEMVYFGGCPIKTAAEIRGVSTKTVSRHLELAEKWLQTRMSSPPSLEKAASSGRV
jgi:RNA polymerase sigma factor (TIGR02999 family)